VKAFPALSFVSNLELVPSPTGEPLPKVPVEILDNALVLLVCKGPVSRNMGVLP